jgi:glycosyltransferase involved in cell wall biosynthesis
MDEEMESRGDLTSPGARTTFASASAAVPATGCRAGVITELSVVIPVYNEAAAILETIDEVGKALPECGLEAFEIVVVDDGSSDGSAELVADLSHVRVVRHPCNAGYGRALKSGIYAAAYDTIAISDADLTYPVDMLPDLLREYRRGFDMVVGARTGEAYRGSAIKAPLRSLLKWLVEFTTGKRVPDVNSGFRLFDRRTALRYDRHLCDTFSFTTSLTLAYEMNGLFTRYLPIPYRIRVEETKVRLLRDSLRTLQYITQAAVYYNPLKLFILLAVGCFGIAIAGFLGSALLGLRSGFLVGVGAVVLSVQVVVLGFLSVLLKQIMDK